MKIDEGVRVAALDLIQIKDEFRRVLHYLSESVVYIDANAAISSGDVATHAALTGVAVHGLGTAAIANAADFALASHTQLWSTITNRPSTLSGYGITADFNLHGDARWLAVGGAAAGIELHRPQLPLPRSRRMRKNLAADRTKNVITNRIKPSATSDET